MVKEEERIFQGIVFCPGDPELVAQDVLEGYVSPESARSDYMVALDPVTGGLVMGAWALGLLVVIGLRINPTPFPAYPARTPPLQTVPLPAGLPEPVDRFYRTDSSRSRGTGGTGG